MRRSEEGISVARAILSVDTKLTESPGTPAYNAQLQARELRDAAIEELKRAYTTASTTSGPLDKKTLTLSQMFASAASKIASNSATAADHVTTIIRPSAPGTALFYLPMRKYRAKQWEWQSYSSGAKLPIGGYYFRVVQASSQVHDEFVLVFDDPTERTINDAG
jgi:hypothetical protein